VNEEAAALLVKVLTAMWDAIDGLTRRVAALERPARVCLHCKGEGYVLKSRSDVDYDAAPCAVYCPVCHGTKVVPFPATNEETIE
jgi:hypothetical protein